MVGDKGPGEARSDMVELGKEDFPNDARGQFAKAFFAALRSDRRDSLLQIAQTYRSDSSRQFRSNRDWVQTIRQRRDRIGLSAPMKYVDLKGRGVAVLCQAEKAPSNYTVWFLFEPGKEAVLKGIDFRREPIEGDL